MLQFVHKTVASKIQSLRPHNGVSRQNIPNIKSFEVTIYAPSSEIYSLQYFIIKLNNIILVFSGI